MYTWKGGLAFGVNAARERVKKTTEASEQAIGAPMQDFQTVHQNTAPAHLESKAQEAIVS